MSGSLNRCVLIGHLARQAINNDRSAYTQQGLRPAGGEPWRGHAGGVDESFFWAARPANARGQLIRSCTVRSWRRRIRLCGRFPYRPTIGGACGMYRPPIGPVSAIERAIACNARI